MTRSQYVLLYAVATVLLVGMLYLRWISGEPQAVWFFGLFGLHQ